MDYARGDAATPEGALDLAFQFQSGGHVTVQSYLELDSQYPEESIVKFMQRVGRSARYLIETKKMDFESVVMMLASKLEPEIQGIFRAAWQADWNGPKKLDSYKKIEKQLMQIERLHIHTGKDKHSYVKTNINRTSTPQKAKPNFSYNFNSQEERDMAVRVVRKLKSDTINREVDRFLSNDWPGGGEVAIQAVSTQNYRKSSKPYVQKDGYQKRRTPRVCWYCEKEGHLRQDCEEYRKSKANLAPDSSVKSGIKQGDDEPFCLVCGKTNHTTENCFKRKREPVHQSQENDDSQL